MKLSRLMGILTILLNRPRVTCQELADHFEVSLRTIYRDVEELSMAGIPLVTFPGKSGGIGIMESFRLDYHTFTPKELAAIISSLQGLTARLGDTDLKQALGKLENLSHNHPSQSHQTKIALELGPWGLTKKEQAKINSLHSATQQYKRIRLSYISAQNERTQRDVEPLTLVLKGANWYIYGYCLLKQDYRLFKISRILELVVLAETFAADKHIVSGTPWNESWDDDGPIVKLVLKFPAQLQVRVFEVFGEDQIQENPDGCFTVTVNYPEDNWITSMLLSFGSQVEIIEPSHIREVVCQEAKKILKLYS